MIQIVGLQRRHFSAQFLETVALRYRHKIFIVEFIGLLPFDAPANQRSESYSNHLEGRQIKTVRLPKEIVTRPKTGFGVPLRRWLKEELRDYVNDTLSVDRIKRRGIFRPDYVQELLAWNETGQRDVSYTLFSLLCFEVWFEKYLDDGV